MADRNKAHTIQVGPVSKITAPDDPLSLLPKELLDNIYSLALHSEDGPWTFHIKSTVQPWRYGSNNDLDRLLSLLALPQDRRYKARRMKNPDEVWPDNVERACFVGKVSPPKSSTSSALIADCVCYSQLWIGRIGIKADIMTT